MSWKDLKEKLEVKGILLGINEVEKVFSISDEENNPFFSVRENVCDVNKLIESYENSERNWKSNILHQFNRAELDFK